MNVIASHVPEQCLWLPVVVEGEYRENEQFMDDGKFIDVLIFCLFPWYVCWLIPVLLQRMHFVMTVFKNTLIGHTVQKTTKAWITLRHATGVQGFSTNTALYLIFSRSPEFFRILLKNRLRCLNIID